MITAYLQGDPPKPGDDLTSEMVGETFARCAADRDAVWIGLVAHASDLLASCKHGIASFMANPTGPLRRGKVLAIYRSPVIVAAMG